MVFSIEFEAGLLSDCWKICAGTVCKVSRRAKHGIECKVGKHASKARHTARQAFKQESNKQCRAKRAGQQWGKCKPVKEEELQERVEGRARRPEGKRTVESKEGLKVKKEGVQRRVREPEIITERNHGESDSKGI